MATTTITKTSKTKPSAAHLFANIKGLNDRAIKYKHVANRFLNIPVLSATTHAKPVTHTTIRQAFLDVSMVNRHRGLSLIAKEAKIDVNTLKPGEFVLFINPGRTKLALFGALGALTYIAHPRGHKISTQILNSLPQIFKGTTFDYDQALKPFLENHLQVKRTRIKKDTNSSS